MSVEAQNLQVSPSALAPGTVVSGWRVLEPLRAGSFAVLYLVEHVTEPGVRFVLKISREQRDARVVREIALLMTQAVHPHVVSLQAYGRWPHPETGYLYCVMDWVQGPPLHTWAETRNDSIRSVVEKLATVALTLEHLHADGVFHRDLKPEHILIHEPEGKPVLIDFGVGWYDGAGVDASQGMVLGTPHLRSPEAVACWRKYGGKPGARYVCKPTDEVFALGVSAYRVLTGHWPFPPHLAREELFAAIEGLTPPAPSLINRRVPRVISDVVLRMIAKRVQDRLQSCAEVHAALVAAMSFAGSDALDMELFEYEWMPGASQTARRPKLRVRLPQWPEAPQPAAGPRVNRLPRLSGVFLALVGLTALGGLAAKTLPTSAKAFSAKAPKVNQAMDPTGPSEPEQLATRPPVPGGDACPLEAIMNMRHYDMGGMYLRPVELVSEKKPVVIEVRDNEKVVWGMANPWGNRVPQGSKFHGRLWVRERLYGRFDRMVLPDGTQESICLEFWQSQFVTDAKSKDVTTRLVAGTEFTEPSPAPGVGRVDIQTLVADPVKRWGALKPGVVAE